MKQTKAKIIKEIKNNYRSERIKREKAITLIALVITIIVLLILAGVTVATLTGDNGILTRARDAGVQTEIASEREAIELSLINELSQGEEYVIGTSLYDKTMDNATIWDIIVLNENIYGTNWKYISENTEVVDYGKTKYEWLVNCETGEVICLSDTDYTRLTHGQSLGVTDGLIFNLDPSVIDDTDIETIKGGDTSVLGNDVELKNFNWTDDSGLTPSTLNFDGIDDYITVKYDNAEEKNTLAQNGFTFEYYGVLDDGTSYDKNENIIEHTFKGIFCYWNGNEAQQAAFRFGSVFLPESIHLVWSAGGRKIYI